ncbi:MAG: hypothetical protein FWC28_05890 [Proteobacteria bacterium]|nr:hypothetical protein [Cystobacterineae bacterium]MCL2314763.1 hypothetical protein [Pseudomonadota bacterium]
MTIKIDRLSLRLPRGFESRANAIVRQVGAELNQQNDYQSVHIEQLKLPPISVSPHEGDSAVAQKVVAAILQGIERRQN